MNQADASVTPISLRSNCSSAPMNGNLIGTFRCGFVRHGALRGPGKPLLGATDCSHIALASIHWRAEPLGFCAGLRRQSEHVRPARTSQSQVASAPLQKVYWNVAQRERVIASAVSTRGGGEVACRSGQRPDW